MTKSLLHKKAISLRKAGESINAIAQKLRISKSTTSIWCKDISLTKEQIRTIALKSRHHATLALLSAAERRRKKRLLDIADGVHMGKKDVGSLSRRDIYMVGLGLYWGEGYKKGSQELGFTNSDPGIISFYIYWLNKIYNISSRDLILRVSINNSHQHRVLDVEQYWSSLTGIPLSQFTKTSLIKTISRKQYKNPNDHYGTLRVKARRCTQLRRRILGSIEGLQIR